MRFKPPTKEQVRQIKAIYNRPHKEDAINDPRIDQLVEELIGRVADKWTMIILELLVEHQQLRFTQLSRQIGTISQKMLTQTLRFMERDGLVARKVYPVVPPKVEYRLTELGLTLSAAFCGVWVWAADNLTTVESARKRFDKKIGKAKLSL
ncbi:MAG: helix-turn-helix domain-containing protein [Alphaproteobacteria bacterium]